MFKIEIDIGEYNWSSSEKVTIETNNFELISIIQEFIEFQQLHGWCVDYDVTEDYEYQCDEEEVDADDSAEGEESEEYEIGEIVEDDDGVVWERVA
jgi:hypothetical protein